MKNIKIFIYSFIFLINSNLCLSQNIFYADLETVIKKSIADHSNWEAKRNGFMTAIRETQKKKAQLRQSISVICM